MSPIRHSSRSASRGAVLRVLVWVVSIVLLLTAGALTVFDWVLRQKYEPTLGQHRKETTSQVGFFCEQQAKLAADPWFHEPRTEGDAGVLLSAWVPWDPSPPLPKGSPLNIPEGLPQDNSSLTNWLTSGASVDVSKLDFGWMRQLHAYDRWDIFQHHPVPLPQRINWATSCASLTSSHCWCGRSSGCCTDCGQEHDHQAARDVRQLAWLAYRTDTLLGGVIATSILRQEREAYEWMESMEKPPADWAPTERRAARPDEGPLPGQPGLLEPRDTGGGGEAGAQLWRASGDALHGARGELGLRQAPAAAGPGSVIGRIRCPGAGAHGAPLCHLTHENDPGARRDGAGGEPDPLIQSQVDWPDSLPGAYTRRHVVGILLAISSQGQEQAQGAPGRPRVGKVRAEEALSSPRGDRASPAQRLRLRNGLLKGSGPFFSEAAARLQAHGSARSPFHPRAARHAPGVPRGSAAWRRLRRPTLLHRAHRERQPLARPGPRSAPSPSAGRPPSPPRRDP